MRITMLGTGNAVVTRCYNTCFVLTGTGRRLLVDGGGGSGLLAQMERARIDPRTIEEVFVTHKHIDHLLGVLWLMRAQSYLIMAGFLRNGVRIYAHDQVVGLLHSMAHDLLNPREAAMVGNAIQLVEVHDGETRGLMGHQTTFFDIRSSKAKQFGFAMDLGDERTLCCCGDESLTAAGEPYARGAHWLLHEAFCLESEASVFRPHEKHHATVASAAATAERLGVANLLLYHTEDTHYDCRKQLYEAEARQHFSGNVFVPYDLESLEL